MRVRKPSEITVPGFYWVLGPRIERPTIVELSFVLHFGLRKQQWYTIGSEEWFEDIDDMVVLGEGLEPPSAQSF
jgi:hypothetical protein